MAETAGFSATTLSQAAAGERLPSLAVVQGYVRACGGDPAEWAGRWQDAEAQTESARATAPTRPRKQFACPDRRTRRFLRALRRAPWPRRRPGPVRAAARTHDGGGTARGGGAAGAGGRTDRRP
ncbi:helix-turn-helix domain-containing protein [Streptomyces sp. B4I13]|uniref:helix-turn-helix domain-containing protein n=1 Tax=Streptomyces sp. B4I13 TaxID=3042271 RepID=UPI0035943061